MGVTLCVVSLKCLSNRVTRWHVLLRFFSFFPFLPDNFHICIQSNLSKIFGTANTACDVTVILSMFLFSSEVVSHTAFGNASLAQLSLQSGFQWRKKMWQHAACDKSSNQTYISSVPYVGILSYLVLLNIMIAPERVRVLQNVLFNTECLQASTTEYSSTEIIHVS